MSISHQGHARLTAGVDLVIDLERSNIKRAIDALTARGLRPLLPVNPMDFADATLREHWITSKNLQVFSMRDEHNPLMTVDLFAREPSPVEELWTRADEVVLSGETVRVASIPDLIRMKRAAARPQDLADIEQLERIVRKRRDG